MVSVVHDLPLDLDVLVWQKGNIKYSEKQTRSYKLFTIKNKTYKI